MGWDKRRAGEGGSTCGGGHDWIHRAAAATGVMMTVEWGISVGKAHEWRKERSNSNCRRRGGTRRGGVEAGTEIGHSVLERG